MTQLLEISQIIARIYDHLSMIRNVSNLIEDHLIIDEVDKFDKTLSRCHFDMNRPFARVGISFGVENDCIPHNP